MAEELTIRLIQEHFAELEKRVKTTQLAILEHLKTVQVQSPIRQIQEQFAELEKRIETTQLAILEQLKTVQAKEIAVARAVGQAECLKVTRSRENWLTVGSDNIEATDRAECSKIAKRSGEENLFFPDEMVEKILARMSLPSLFKIPSLSKSWSAKFPIPSKNSSLTTFQKEVISASSNWITWNPVFYTKDGFRGYDRVSSQWKPPMFTLSQLPLTHWDPYASITSVGSLMLVVSDIREDQDLVTYGSDFTDIAILLTNVITRSWDYLIIPSRIDNYLQINGLYPDFTSLLPGDFHTYRILVVYQYSEDQIPWQVKTIIYDSSVNEWSVTYSQGVGSMNKFSSSSVYLHGKLYCICDGERIVDPWKLCIHHVDSDKTWMAIPLDFSSSSGIVAAGVVRCGKKIMVVTWGRHMHREGATSSRNSNVTLPLPVVHLYEFDIPSSKLVSQCNGPPNKSMLGVGFYQEGAAGTSEERIGFASDADSIYCSQTINGILVMMITYNVRSGEWGWFPPVCHTFGSMNCEKAIMLESAFVPGINPFADV